MLDVLERCFPENFPGWKDKITEMIPSFGTELSESPEAAREELAATAAVLRLAN